MHPLRSLETRTFTLRRYASEAPAQGAALLLVPPLMVTSEIYDISPELSAVSWLGGRAVDVWLVDFGRPEDAEHGLERTLDDHVLAVDACIDHVREATGQDVHVAGYSQGGMFVYQVAAYRRTEGIASLVTFGSPVDIHRNVPAMHDAVAGRLLKGVRTAVKRPLQKIDGLPGALTSTGFKVLSARRRCSSSSICSPCSTIERSCRSASSAAASSRERGSSRGRDLRSATLSTSSLCTTG